MYMSDYTVQLLHDERLREAAESRSQRDLIRDASEQCPTSVRVVCGFSSSSGCRLVTSRR